MYYIYAFPMLVCCFPYLQTYRFANVEYYLCGAAVSFLYGDIIVDLYVICPVLIEFTKSIVVMVVAIVSKMFY